MSSSAGMHMVDFARYREGRRLHPLTLVQRFLISVPAFLLLLVPVLRGSDPNVYLTLLYVFLIAVFTLPFIVVRYVRFRYWITPEEIVIRSGVFTIQHRNIPIDRVQNIEIERNLLARMMGLSKVGLQTAGSQSTEGVLEYVDAREALEIREVIRTYRRRAETTGDEAATSAQQTEASHVLFRMSPPRVLLSGAFRFSLLYVAVIFSGIQYLGLDPEEIADWIENQPLDALSTLADVSAYAIAVISLLAVTLFSWLTGIVININRFHRFELSRQGNKLHIRSGLFTVAERTIPLRKIQAIAIGTNPLMKSFGWYAVEVQTMGVETEQTGRHVVAPFARLDEIEPLLLAITPERFAMPLNAVSRVTIRRTFVRLAFLIGAVAALLSFLWVDSWWLLALIPFALYYAFCHYRIHGYGIEGDALTVRRGVFSEMTWLLPASKFQVFYQSSSIFQRRLGLASVYVD
ncbi:MAG: PH domain-containing protein, partial [Rhodothermales bacterium]